MREPWPIPVNPGGALAIEHILGRAAVSRHILKTLETRSVVLTGERRMGKTSLARLVEHLAPTRGWTVIRQSAEGFDSLDDPPTRSRPSARRSTDLCGGLRAHSEIARR